MTNEKIDLVRRKLLKSGLAAIASGGLVGAAILATPHKASANCPSVCSTSCPGDCSVTCNTCSQGCSTCQTGSSK